MGGGEGIEVVMMLLHVAAAAAAALLLLFEAFIYPSLSCSSQSVIC